MRPGSARRAIAWGLAAGVAVAAVAAWAWPFTIDDAYIPCRYAQNLALGRGLCWNPGERAAGVTGVFWTFLLALARLAGLRDLPLVAKVMGLATSVALAALVVGRTRRQAGGRRGGALIVLAGLATSLSFAVYAIAGLETSAFTLAVTLAGMAPARGRWGAAGLAAGASAAIRPEGLLVFAIVVASALVHARGRAALRAAAAGAGPVLVAMVVSWVAFGTLVPDTLAARRAPSGAGLAYLAGALVPTGAILWGPLAAAGAVFSRSRRTAFALVFGLVVGVGVVGGDWMPGWRFLVPVWPLMVWLAARGALALRVRLRARLGAIVVAFAVLGALLLGAATTAAVLPEVRSAGVERVRAAPRLVRTLRRLGVRHVALVDVGFVGWSIPSLRTTDLAGLTDRTIARAPGVYLDKRVDEAYLLERAPDAIVLHAEGPRGAGMFPVERRVAALPFVAARYHLSATVSRSRGYRYLVLCETREK